MSGFLYVLTSLLLLYLCLCLGVVTIEALCALAGFKQVIDVSEPMPSTVILIPAHNEQEVIVPTLQSLQADLPEHTRIVCVAHNCTDGTAALATAHGAEVVVVNDDGTGGKPAALKAGLAWLDRDPPEVVVIVDADCNVAPGSIRLLATQAKIWNTPVMGCYLFTSATDTARTTFSSLAIMLKNFIRPLGLWRLGLPCLLNGSGSAYPFSLLRNAPHGEGSIAEDYQLTVDLLECGYPTRFVPAARIVGQLPHKDATAQKQRRRWEHGHLYLSLHVAPRLLLAGISQLDRNRLAIGLDLLVPPLAYLALIGGVEAILAFGQAMLGQVWPLQVLSVSVVLFGVSLMLAWSKYAGLWVTLQTLAALPQYVLWKLPIYRDYFWQRETRWMKTERD